MKLCSNFTSRLRFEGNGEWTKREPTYNEKAKDYPIVMNHIPDCGNFHLQYPGCVKGIDNIFQEIHVNITNGERKLNMSVFTESRGWTSHAHALTSIICAIIGLSAVVIDNAKVADIFLFLTLGNIAATLGCMRQKLKAMSK